MNKFLIAWISVALFSISIGITYINKNMGKQIKLQEFSLKMQGIEMVAKYCKDKGSFDLNKGDFNCEWR